MSLKLQTLLFVTWHWDERQNADRFSWHQFHGTNQEERLGQAVARGYIRMRH